MTYIPTALYRLVVERANHRCEYCLLPDRYTYQPFEVDHVFATKHRGETTEENLCYSCFTCNRHKGSDLTSLDEDGETIIRLFHPRRDLWSEHFSLNGPIIEGKTETGRVTANLLQFNNMDRIAEREDLINRGKYP
jgi:hypothetical protein